MTIIAAFNGEKTTWAFESLDLLDDEPVEEALELEPELEPEFVPDFVEPEVEVAVAALIEPAMLPVPETPAEESTALQEDAVVADLSEADPEKSHALELSPFSL